MVSFFYITCFYYVIVGIFGGILGYYVGFGGYIGLGGYIGFGGYMGFGYYLGG